MKKDLKILFNSLLITAFIILFFVSSLVCSGVGFTAYAATATVSGVLDDLQKDETFNSDEYPAVDNDYSLQVIQIAESSAGELFIYVYQPAVNVLELIATEIRLSQSIGENIAPKDYKLSLLNRDGVFCKYLVNDLTIKKDVVHYYDLICIFRPWCSDIDKSTGNDNVINSVQYEVAKLYTACTVNGVVTYSCEVEKVVTITEKYVDFLRYLDGFKIGNWSMGSCDSHYIAFSCDYSIDELYSADVYYSSQSFYHPSLGAEQYGQIEDKNVTLNYTDKVSNPADGIGGTKYTWERIEKVSDFVKKESVSNEVKKQLNGKQWVLRFCETEYSKSILPGSYGTVYTESKTLVTSVSILRLHFKSNGVVYNLGVVDNKQSGDDIPGNQIDKTLWEKFIDFCKWLESVTGVSYVIWAIIILAVPVCLLLGVAIPVLSVVFPAFGSVVKSIFKAVFWVVTLPFRGIAWVFKKIIGCD